MSLSSFSPMEWEEINTVMESSSASDLYAFILTNQDIMLGGFYQQVKSDKYTLNVAFNMPAGKLHGESRIVEIPARQISSIQKVPLSEESIPKFDENDPHITFLKSMREMDINQFIRLPVYNYPNPLASIIFYHNAKIIKKIIGIPPV